MKKLLKKILIITAILYLIFSLGYNIISKAINEESLEGIRTENDIFDFELEECKASTLSIVSLVAEISIIDINLIGIAGSFIIGTVIGLIMSVKENSKVKYALYFIFGLVIYNIIWTLIISMIYSKYFLINVYTFDNLLDTFGYSLIKTFISYILIYAILLIGNMIKNKMQVKELNDSLNNKEKIENKKINIKIDDITKKRIIKIVIAILVFVILIVGAVIARRTIILVNYGKAIKEFNKNENCYIKEESKWIYENDNSKEDITVTEKYYKDGIYVEKPNSDSISYTNTKIQETMYINLNKKEVVYSDYNEYGKYIIWRAKLNNIFYSNNYVGIWQNIMLAFNVGITSEEYNGEQCYVISRGDAKLYISKDNYLAIRKINISYRTTLNSETKQYEEEKAIYDETYSYSINTVKDEDVQKPDITGYEAKRINKEGKLENL